MWRPAESGGRSTERFVFCPTETYLGRPTLDELKRAVAGFKFGLPERTNVLGVLKTPNVPLEATTGIEPV